MSTRAYASKQQQLTPFKVVDFLAAAIRLEASGRDIVRMEAGEPSLPLPEPMREAAHSALHRGSNRYTPPLGILELRRAIAQYCEQRYHICLDPARVLVSTGSSAALGMICDLMLNPGDSVLVADPGYPCNANFIRRCNANAISIPLGPEQYYQPRATDIAAHWREDTAGLMFASPSNPTGDTIAPGEMRQIADLVAARDGFLVADEIYHGLNYGEEGDTSILEITEDAFVINSFSKYFGLPGWRLGWLVAPEDAIRPLEIMAQNFYISPPNISQQVALAAFDPASLACFEVRREEFKARRDFLVPALRSIGFGIPHTPNGAFYVYANIDGFAEDSEQFCWDMLDKAGVAFTPGTDFGVHHARRHVRFSYTEPLDRLEEAVERLAKALGARREF